MDNIPGRRSGTRAILFPAIVALFSSSAMADDQVLVEAAKHEGKVTWYTAQIVNQFARPAAEAFQKKYGISVDYVRSDSETMSLRVFNENKAGHTLADVVDGTSGFPELKQQGLFLKWLPETAQLLPKEAVDPDGYWIANNEFIHTAVFNTNLVTEGTEPMSFEDLLDPRWKGKMAWAAHISTSGAAGFVGTVLTTMGNDQGMSFLRELAKQNVAGLDGSSTSVVNQVAAGEYAIALQVFNHNAVIGAAQGAPLSWTQRYPAMGIFAVSAILRDAPHPNAAKLFETFLVSEAGQQLFRDANYVPVNPAVAPKVPSLRPDGEHFRAIFLTPEQIAGSLGKWFQIYSDYFK